MKPIVYASMFRRLRVAAVLCLLGADLAPQILALLRHLLFDTVRILTGSVLTERLGMDPSFMRGAVFASISQRHASSVLTIDYDSEARGLRLSDDQRNDDGRGNAGT